MFPPPPQPPQGGGGVTTLDFYVSLGSQNNNKKQHCLLQEAFAQPPSASLASANTLVVSVTGRWRTPGTAGGWRSRNCPTSSRASSPPSVCSGSSRCSASSNTRTWVQQSNSWSPADYTTEQLTFASIDCSLEVLSVRLILSRFSKRSRSGL